MSIFRTICDLFSSPVKGEQDTMSLLLEQPPTASNLAWLKRVDIGLFYTLDDSVMELHLFQSKRGDVEFSIDDSVESSSAFADANNKPKLVESLNSWLSDFELFMLDHCKAGEQVVLLAGFYIEDALGLLYDRAFEYPLLARQLNGFESIRQALNKEGDKRKSENYSKNVHVVLAKCPWLSQVFREKPDCTPEQRARYEDNGATFFINEELTEMLQACEDFCHAASLAESK